ncbi:MAG: glycosyltransferase family 4 protein [Spirochaetales bacterium]|nr:glycosyltransferase family 4 protein [Spirochaetales bacterium]
MKTKKTLLLLELPPPVHGVTYMNSILHESLAMKKGLVFFRLNTAGTIGEIGRLTLTRILGNITLILRCWILTLIHRPDKVYFSLSMSTRGLARDFALLFFCLLLNAKRIIHFHGSRVFDAYRKSFIFRILFKLIASNAAGIALGGIHLKRIKDELPPCRKMEVRTIYNAVKDIPAVKGKIPHDPLRLLYIGNISAEKGIYRLMESLEGDRCLLSVAGAFYSGEKNRFNDLLNDAELRNGVRYVGFADDEAKKRLFAENDIFIMPSLLEEGSPISIIEAMAYGMPVIATDKGCIREMITGCGIVLPGDFGKSELNLAIRACSSRYGEFSEEAMKRCSLYYGKNRFLSDLQKVFFS